MSRKGKVRRVITAAATAASVAMAAPTPASSQPTAAPAPRALATATTPQWVEGELLVEFRKGASSSERARVHGIAGVVGGRRLGRTNIELVSLPPGLSVADAAQAYLRNDDVVAAEPNLLRAPTAIPNDSFFAELWGLNNTGQTHGLSDSSNVRAGSLDADIDAAEAWDTETGSSDTVVAVLDSGTDVAHPDLDGSLWVNPGEIAGNGSDDDGNGLVDDVHGWDFARDRKALLETGTPVGYDHGTHVAGTIAAERGNGLGVAGVCPGCKIMTLKFMRPFSVGGTQTMLGDLASEIRAIDYAIAEGATIINGSFGQPYAWSGLERKAFVRAGNAGILSVLAAGNSNGDNDMLVSIDANGDNRPDLESPFFPASYGLSSIVAVAASNHKDQYGYFTMCGESLGTKGLPCSFTSWGRESVDLAAPGVDVLSTVPGAGYAFFAGTSMATPHVAGVAGLVKSRKPSVGPKGLKSALLTSVDKPASLRKLSVISPDQTGDFTLTSGRLNAAGALTASTSTTFPVSDGAPGGAVGIDRSRSGRVAWPADVNDLYRKRLERGRTYKVILDGPAGKDFDLVVWSPGIKDTWQLESGCFEGGSGPCKLVHYNPLESADESARFRANKSGVFFFQVSSYFATGDYTLRVRRV